MIGNAVFDAPRAKKITGKIRPVRRVDLSYGTALLEKLSKDLFTPRTRHCIPHLTKFSKLDEENNTVTILQKKLSTKREQSEPTAKYENL
jgi:hypothetical protein